MISASHNPWRDNGIKFFGADGRKLADEAEARIEALVGAGGEAAAAATRSAGSASSRAGSTTTCASSSARFPLDLSGRRVVLDCANGATYRAAPAIFERLGAEVEAIDAEPDGRNINEGCGSTHPEALAERVRRAGASIGFAFDGDGDRVVAVDSDGRRPRRRRADRADRRPTSPDAARLGGGVAVTVMSNYGFHKAMAEAGIEVATTPVGDRNVSPSSCGAAGRSAASSPGHLIWTEFAPSGDGIAAALLTLRGARRRATSPTCEPDGAPAAGARERRGRRPRRGRRRERASGRRSSARARRSRAAAGSWYARRAPSRWSG